MKDVYLLKKVNESKKVTYITANDSKYEKCKKDHYVTSFYHELFCCYYKIPNCTVCKQIVLIYSSWLKCFITDYEAIKEMVNVCEKYKESRKEK